MPLADERTVNSVVIHNASSAAFVSDIHLSSDDPETEAMFFGFLRSLGRRRPDCLFILGDLFEYWAGDDGLDEPLAARVIEQLRLLGAMGIALYFVAGNRDFLIGGGFARASGVSILADPTLVELGTRTFLISHGDTLCTDDRSYQEFRAMVRSPRWQKAFLAKSLSERRELIGQFRNASDLAKKDKSHVIMDVNEHAVMELFRSTNQAVLIHGHTHRPACHDFEVDGFTYERWVLPDWDAHAAPPHGGGVYLDATGFVSLAVVA